MSPLLTRSLPVCLCGWQWGVVEFFVWMDTWEQSQGAEGVRIMAVVVYPCLSIRHWGHGTQDSQALGDTGEPLRQFFHSGGKEWVATGQWS